MNFLEVIEYSKKLNKKNLCVAFTQDKITFFTLDYRPEFVIDFINNTNLIDIVIQNNELIKIQKLSKMIKLNNYEVLQKNDFITIQKEKSFYQITVTKDIIEFDVTAHDLKEYEYCGSLDNLQINELILKAKKLVKDEFRPHFDNYYISNKNSYITDSFICFKDKIDLKDCMLNVNVLNEMKNEKTIKVYNKLNKEFVYKSENLEKSFKKDNSFGAEHIEYIFPKITLNFTIKNDFKPVAKSNIEFDFKNKKVNFYEYHTENFICSYELDCMELDYKVQFDFNKFNTVIGKSESIKFEIQNYVQKPIILNNHILMPLSENAINNIDFTPENLLELQNKINAFESNNQTPVITKEITEVKTTKTKKAKIMNLKKEIKLAPKKSKYFEPVEEILEEIKEIEIVTEIAPVIDLHVEKIKIEPVKKVKQELSKTVITPKFDLIDFIFKSCYNDLKNLDFYNTDYTNNRLYLTTCELSFIQHKNSIEVIELDMDCNIYPVEVKDKKELLNLVRSKIKDAA